MPEISERFSHVFQCVESAAKVSGRKFSDIVIVGVTKGVEVSRIQQARALGVGIFGENRLQEASEKVTQVDAQWHMIGHLQSNKALQAVRLFTLIQSVDSLRIAEKIHEAATLEGKKIAVLLEINLSGEPQKYGFGAVEIYGALEELKKLPALDVRGLMGIAPNTPDGSLRRESFRKLKTLFGVCSSVKATHFNWQYLSMGMSDDYQIAIEEGSNMIRLGRALFGERA